MREGKIKVTQGIMIKPKYQIFIPGCTGTFEEQWSDCFNEFQLFQNKYPNQKAFIARVFVGANSPDEYFSYSKQIENRLNATVIPFSVLAESPESPVLVMIEAGFVNSTGIQIEYGIAGTVRYSKINSSGYNEYWFAGVGSGAKDESTREKSANAFASLLEAFLKLGIGFNSVFRQWNYVEQIFDFDQVENRQRQNYQLFNEIRNEYYSKYLTGPGFPAATGIGTNLNGVTIECMAVTSDSDVTTVAISNPKQINSYKYGQEVLKGDPQSSCKQNQPPQFERARLMTNGHSSRLLISGTASIVGQETIGLNDVEEQTYVTIENIGQLVSEKNLRAHYPELTVFPDKYAYVRVYVKNEEDIPTVKVICENHFRAVPMSFVKADICRADLLVEIEAEMIS